MRDIILNDVPSAFSNPRHLIFSTLPAGISLLIAFYAGQKFREVLFLVSGNRCCLFYILRFPSDGTIAEMERARALGTAISEDW